MKTTICHKNGCYNKALEGKHFCALHISMEKTWGKRPLPARKKSSAWHHLYNSDRWKKMSREFLAKFPTCARCGAPAKIADHIHPHRGNELLFYDPLNLQPLCWRCHSAKTLEENNFFKEQIKAKQKKN